MGKFASSEYGEEMSGRYCWKTINYGFLMYVSVLRTAFVLDCFFMNVCMKKSFGEKRDSVTLWDSGRVCLLYS